MKLRPLGHRVFIKPELPAETTASGLILAEHRKPEQTGTVVAVGPCHHPRQQDAFDLARRVDELVADALDSALDVQDQVVMAKAATLLRDLVRKEPDVKVGDYVVFSWMAGQEIWVEDGEERYLSMNEADIMAVVEGLDA